MRADKQRVLRARPIRCEVKLFRIARLDVITDDQSPTQLPVSSVRISLSLSLSFASERTVQLRGSNLFFCLELLRVYHNRDGIWRIAPLDFRQSNAEQQQFMA